VFHRKVGSLELLFFCFCFPPPRGGARGLAPWLLRPPLLGVWSLGHVLILMLRAPEVWGSGAFIGLFALFGSCESSAFFLTARSWVARFGSFVFLL